ASATQSVAVQANNDFTAFVVGGAIGGGIAGIGGGVDVGILHNNTAAYVDLGAQVHATDNITVQATADKDITSVALSVGVGVAGIAGSVTVWSIGEPVSGEYSTDDSNSDDALSGSTLTDFADSQSSGSDPHNGYTNVLSGFTTTRQSP